MAVHVLVNGSTDSTAAIARAAAASNLTVHEWPEGGKALSWNRFVHGVLTGPATAHLFADGDAEIEVGSLDALVGALADHPGANAAAALPLNGRRVDAIRLPDDLVGDDGLIAAIAKTDGQDESRWDEARVVSVPALYPDWLPRFRPRPSPALRLYDHLALARMARQAGGRH